MKITSFSFTVRQAITGDGHSDNYYVIIDDNGGANVSHPYKAIPYKEQKAIFGVIQSAIGKYAELVALCDIHNRALNLEEYASAISSEEEKAIAAAKLSAAQELESLVNSASLQSCALGGGEVSTGADGDIDNPTSTIVISKVTEEDD